MAISSADKVLSLSESHAESSAYSKMPLSETSDFPETGLNDNVKAWLKDAKRQSEELKFLLDQSKRVASEATAAIKKDYDAQVKGLREQLSLLQQEASVSRAAWKKSIHVQEDLNLDLRSAKAELDAMRCRLHTKRYEAIETIKAREKAANLQLEKVQFPMDILSGLLDAHRQTRC